MACDPNGDVYAAESDLLRRITPQGWVTTVEASGTTVLAGRSGVRGVQQQGALPGSINSVLGLVSLPDGKLAMSSENRVPLPVIV